MALQSPSSTGGNAGNSSTVGNPNPLQILSNIHNLVPFKLDGNNFVIWKHQISSLLRTQSLLGFVDGSTPCPPKFLANSSRSAASASSTSASDGSAANTSSETDGPADESNAALNPAYSNWLIQDQALVTLLNATLSQEALSLVIGQTSSRSIWLALERRYASLSRSNILQLKNELQTMKKRSDSIDEYLQKMKNIRDKLTVANSYVDDEDMLLYVLNGLPPEFNSLRTSIGLRSEPISLEELHAILKSVEQMNESQNSVPSTESIPSAFNTTTTGNSNSGQASNRGRGRGRNHHNNNRGGSNRHGGYGRQNDRHGWGRNNHTRGGRHDHNRSRNNGYNNGSNYYSGSVVCQICGQNYHTALDCIHRMDYAYQGRMPPNQLTAMNASTQSNSNNFWLSDTGATNHMTNDFGNLSISDTYMGSD